MPCGGWRTKSGRCWLKSRTNGCLSCVGACRMNREVQFGTKWGLVVVDAGTRVSRPPVAGVVLSSHAGELARGTHHRPPQPLAFPRHRHRLQLPGVRGAFWLPPRLPHEPPQKMRSLVTGERPREPAAGCFALRRWLNFPAHFKSLKPLLRATNCPDLSWSVPNIVRGSIHCENASSSRSFVKRLRFGGLFFPTTCIYGHCPEFTNAKQQPDPRPGKMPLFRRR